MNKTPERKIFLERLHALPRWLAQAAFFLVLIAPLFFIAIYSYSGLWKSLTDATIKQYEQKVSLTSIIIDERLKALRSVGISLAIRPELVDRVQQGDWEGSLAALEKVREVFPLVERGFLADVDGVIRADLAKLDNATDTARTETDWYKSVTRTWQPYLSEIFLRWSVPRRNVVNMVLPVEAYGREVVGILVLQMNVEEFGDMIRSIDKARDGKFLVVDQGGHIVYHPSWSADEGIIDVSSQPVVGQILRGRETVDIVKGHDGKRSLVISRKIGDFGWGLVVTIPEEIVFAHRDESLRVMGLLYGLFFLLNIILAGVLWRLLMRLRDNTVQLNGEIEERKHTEKELVEAKNKSQQEESWWRSLVQEVPAVTFVFNRDGSIRSINREFVGILPGQLVGRLFAEHLDLHEQQVFEDVLRKVFEQKISLRYESRVLMYLGGTIWYENYIGPVEVSGEVVGAICLSFDITERKLAQEQLKEMSLAIEHCPVAVVITDHFGRIEYVNPRFSLASGYRFEEVYGQTLRILREGELPEQVRSQLQQTIEKGMNWSGEYQERRKDGIEFWESVTISPVRGQDGAVTHLIVLKEEITEQRNIRQQKEIDLAFLRDLLNGIPIPVFYKNRQGVFLGCNKAFDDFMGKDREQIIGKTVYDFCPRELADRYYQADEVIFQSNEGQSYEAPVQHADGTKHDVLYFKSVLRHHDGRVMGLVGAMFDMTDRKRIEEELRSNEAQLIEALEEVKMFNLQLEQAQGRLVQQEKLAAIGFLSAGVAHEINNPLGFVQGNLSVLEDYATALLKVAEFMVLISAAGRAGDTEQLRALGQEADQIQEKLQIDYIIADLKKLLGETQDGLERIKKIVSGLRSFARSDSGEMIIANINDVIDGVVNVAWNEIKYRAELVKEYGDIPLVACNPQQLGQVFVNLLVNAAQAIPERGVITIRTLVREGEIVIQISDTGSGIPDDIKNKIFDPFFTTKAPGKGTGLGLSISYDIIKKHGGQIELQSKIGEGTTFSVVLPLKQESKKEGDGS